MRRESVTLPGRGPGTAAGRWLGLLLLFRAVATGVAVALLAVQQVTPHDDLLVAIVVVYAAVTGALLVRYPSLAAAPLLWAVDILTAGSLLADSGDWRSPFYLLCLTALALPAATLGRRSVAILGVCATAAFALIAHMIGPDPLALTAQVSIETLAIHLALPGLVCLGIGSAAEVMRRLEQSQAAAGLMAIEAERRRIAWELHDSAKQRLHAAHLLLSSIEGPQGGRAGRLIGLAVDELRAASADMDTSLAELRLPLEGRRLGHALRERVGQMSAAGGPRVDIHGDIEDITAQQTAHAYRIAAEAVTNAIRHADAKGIRVDLEVRDREALVTIADDGRGMPDQTRPGATGLLAMYNRAETIGGALSIEPGPDRRGTRVQLSFPLRQKEPQ